jgi:gamma-tubulin complex component 2
MWFYLHPTLHTLSLLYSLTSTLVSLNIADPDDSDSDSEGSTNDGIGGEGLRDVLNGIRSGGAATTTKAWTTGVAKGGEVLAVLAERMERTSGDPTALQLYSTLLLRASQPYVGILLSWISSGHLSDPWEEFIVKEGKGRGLETDYTDEYWERRYTLRDKGSKKGAVGPGGVRESPRTRGLVAGAIVPDFLEPWKNKILLAGKYLNVIRECGIEIVIPASHQDGKDELIAMNEQS